MLNPSLKLKKKLPKRRNKDDTKDDFFKSIIIQIINVL